jgi:hypothetical protein
MKKTLPAVLAMVVGLSFVTATIVRGEEQATAPAPTAPAAPEASAEKKEEPAKAAEKKGKKRGKRAKRHGGMKKKEEAKP